MKKNTPFTISFTAFKTDLYEDGAKVVFHQRGEEGGNNPQHTSSFSLTTEPKRYTFSFTSTYLDKNSFHVMIGGENDKPFDIYITDIKFEKGSTATPWTPAPEDITETNIINHTTPFVKNNTIHTLRLYNRALTDEEILQNYQAGHEWTPQIGKREVATTMKPITSELNRKGKGKRELISTMKPITTSLERKGKGKREVISTMKPITSELNRKGVGRREVITTMQPITSSISKKLPPIHADMDIRERTPNITTRERIPKLEVD